MPRGGSRGKKNYKGRGKQFTNEDQLQQELEKEEKAKAWRRKKGIESSDEEEEEAAEGAKAPTRGAPGELPPSESESESDDEDEVEKHKGVEHLIQVENPNRVGGRQTKKVTELDTDGAKPELSRREREELEKQQAKERYTKLHLQGKTEEARADLARLALIKKEREEAAAKREQERKEREEKEKKKKEKS